MSPRKAQPRFPADKFDRSIAQYRKLADQARINAFRAADVDGKNWFLSLANSMAALADALQRQQQRSDQGGSEIEKRNPQRGA